MLNDPIVEETRAARAQLVEQTGESIHAFFEYLREREKHDREGVVTLPPNAPEPTMRHVASP
jgi:hypothetical protein